MSTKRRAFSRTEIIKIHELLKAHLLPVEGSEGLYIYQEGWNDSKIAHAIGKEVSPNALAHVRCELFGNVRVRSPNGTSSALRIEALEDAVRNLVMTVSQLVTKHDKLCDNLSLNRVVDVKHLKNGMYATKGQE